jgi:hypothetical protein
MLGRLLPQVPSIRTNTAKAERAPATAAPIPATCNGRTVNTDRTVTFCVTALRASRARREQRLALSRRVLLTVVLAVVVPAMVVLVAEQARREVHQRL